MGPTRGKDQGKPKTTSEEQQYHTSMEIQQGADLEEVMRVAESMGRMRGIISNFKNQFSDWLT